MAKAKSAPKSNSPKPEQSPNGKQSAGLSKDRAIEFYRQMLMIRRFEEKTEVAYRHGKVGGYMHVYTGMEATVVGWTDALQIGYDYVICAYRDHPHPLLMGSDPVAVMSEIMGRSGGLSRGKGGSMHLYDIERGLFGGWGIVGGHTALGGGLAFAAKYRGEDRVTVCYLGDGAANAGVFFETMNMCGLWDLPIIFIIENNEFAMGTRLEHHAADTELYKRGLAFDFECERVDGMDVIQVQKDAKRIVDWVRKNQKPYLVEVMNYRFRGHGAADNDRQLYRTKEEEQEAMLRDPIARHELFLLANKMMTRKQMDDLNEKQIDWVDDIYEKADASPFPDVEEVYDNVYSDMSPEKGH